jgi:hypothetical protein
VSAEAHRLSASSRFTARLVWLYGVYAVVSGAYLFVKGGLLVLEPVSAAGPVESNFIGHLMQAHAGSLVGLGCIACGLGLVRQDLRTLLVPLCIVNALFAIVTLLSAPAPATWLLVEMAIHALWAVVFARAAMSPHTNDSVSDHETAGQSRGLRAILYVSFAALVGMSGVAWLLAPMKFASAAAGDLAGAAAAYVGQTRGVADLVIAALAWSTRTWGGARGGIAITRSLCVSNMLLAIAGLIAQISALATPARWIVETLHVMWALGFALVWRVESRSRGAAGR